MTLRLWIDPKAPDTERACCSPEAVIAARETCHALGLPHVTLDAREGFRRAIVQPFVEGYARGETPNPCTRCNGSFRFAQLLEFARRAGAARLATGHYARIVEHRGRLLLARAADERKDQSYMLARLDPRRLERIWFPLGEQTKDETRAEAERAGMQVAQRAESQEACFLGGGDYREFLERHGLPAREGAVVDEEGLTLGDARGLLAVHSGTAARPRRCDRPACVCGSQRAEDEHGRRRSARVTCAPVGDGERTPVRVGHAGRRETPLPVACPPGRRRGDCGRFPSSVRRARVRSRHRPDGRRLRGRRGRRVRNDRLERRLSRNRSGLIRVVPIERATRVDD